MRHVTDYLARLGTKIFNDLLPAALVSGAVGLGFSHVYQPAPSQTAVAPAPVSAELIQMVRDEHEIMLDYVRKEEERLRVASASAPLRGAVVADNATPAERLSESSLRNAAARKIERKIAAVETKPAIEPVVQRAAGEPLVLTNYVSPIPVPEKRRGVLASTVGEVISVVKKVPDWTRSAAETVLDLPGRIIPSLPVAPERGYLKASF